MSKLPQKITITVNAFSNNKILVDALAETFPNYTKNEIKKRYTQGELIKILNKVDGAIIGLDKISKEVLAQCPNLKIISKYGVGLDNIDFNACKKYGVEVSYEKGVNKRSVSEMTLGFMSGLMRNWYPVSLQLKNNLWNKSGGRDLTGKTIGIIGVGNIGKDLVTLLKPYECKILVNDMRKDKEQRRFYSENNLIESSKETIYRESDVITVHTPLTKQTANLINKEVFLKMKQTSFIINTARGGIVKEDDLLWALKNKIIAGAAVDPYEKEPPFPEKKELLNYLNLICTPHIGGNSEEAILAMGYSAIKGLKDFFENESRTRT